MVCCLILLFLYFSYAQFISLKNSTTYLKREKYPIPQSNKYLSLSNSGQICGVYEACQIGQEEPGYNYYKYIFYGDKYHPPTSGEFLSISYTQPISTCDLTTFSHKERQEFSVSMQSVNSTVYVILEKLFYTFSRNMLVGLECDSYHTPDVEFDSATSPCPYVKTLRSYYTFGPPGYPNVIQFREDGLSQMGIDFNLTDTTCEKIIPSEPPTEKPTELPMCGIYDVCVPADDAIGNSYFYRLSIDSQNDGVPSQITIRTRYHQGTTQCDDLYYYLSKEVYTVSETGKVNEYVFKKIEQYYSLSPTAIVASNCEDYHIPYVEFNVLDSECPSIQELDWEINKTTLQKCVFSESSVEYLYTIFDRIGSQVCVETPAEKPTEPAQTPVGSSILFLVVILVILVILFLCTIGFIIFQLSEMRGRKGSHTMKTALLQDIQTDVAKHISGARPLISDYLLPQPHPQLLTMSRMAQAVYKYGYTLPEGCIWKKGLDPYITNKDGVYKVVTNVANPDEQEVVARLTFVGGQLNGKAKFYKDSVVESCTYKNNKIQGWKCVINYSMEMVRMYYKDGVLERHLELVPDNNNYWKEVDVNTGMIIGYYKLDASYKRYGIGYDFVGGKIEGVYEYNDDQRGARI